MLWMSSIDLRPLMSFIHNRSIIHIWYCFWINLYAHIIDLTRVTHSHSRENNIQSWLKQSKLVAGD